MTGLSPEIEKEAGTTRTRGQHAEIGKLGIWSLELSGADPRKVADAAAELDEVGWGALWIAGAGGTGIWDSARRLLAASKRISVALGVASIWGEDADKAPSEFNALTEGYGSRLLAGFGVSNAHSAAAAGRSYGSPLKSMSDYLDLLDLATPPLSSADRILGALGPRMVALAGERAAGIHPFLVTPESSLTNRAILGACALIAPHQAVVLERDPVRAREIARNGIGFFIGLPSYQANLRRLGFNDADLIPGGSDRLIDAVTAWGHVDDIARRVEQHHQAGADHVALHVLTDHGNLPVDEWRELGSMLT